jgi:uncharacterized protein (TIGR00369 family)
MNQLQTRVLRSFQSQGLMTTLGATLEFASEGEVRIGLPFSQHVSQQHGYVHAGAITSILDSACGYAALTKVPPGHEVVTAEFKINLLRPAVGERFLALGKVVNAGKSLIVCTGEVHAFTAGSAGHKVVALMQATIVSVPGAA